MVIRGKNHVWSYHPLYRVWEAMMSRCTNPNDSSYEGYGRRGIKVCDEWSDYPARFCKWAMKAGYRKGLTLDRVDNDKGYSPDNCAWVSNSDQLFNCKPKGKNRFVGVYKAVERTNLWQVRVGKTTIGYAKSELRGVKLRDQYIINNKINAPLQFATKGAKSTWNHYRRLILSRSAEQTE